MKLFNKNNVYICGGIAVIVGLFAVFCQTVKGNVNENAAVEVSSVSSALEIPKSKSGTEEQILKRVSYTVSYNKDLRLPNWVAWHLKASHVGGKYGRNGLRFEEDTEVPKPRATYFDYMQSGYSRGHMCPSGDNKWSMEAQVQSFLYTNCCPQLYSLNAGDWEELESKCRFWAKKYGSVYIVCGPLLFNQKHKTIGKNKVVVPEAFFKVVMRMGKNPAAIGFVYRNEKTNKKMASYVNTVDDVERMTGIDFFPGLPDKIEKEIESHADIADW